MNQKSGQNHPWGGVTEKLLSIIISNSDGEMTHFFSEKNNDDI